MPLRTGSIRHAGCNALLQRAIASGTLANVTSTVALVILGWLENRRPLTPLNGPSQWIWGRSASHRRKNDLRHTLVGFVIHTGCSYLWSLVDASLQSGKPRATHDALRSLGVAALANIVDYRLTPKRFQPGFQHHLSRRSLAVVYGAFALGLYLAARLRKQ